MDHHTDPVQKVDKKGKKNIVEALIGRRVVGKMVAVVIQVERKKAERGGRGIVIDPIALSMFLAAETKAVEEEVVVVVEQKERVQEIIPAGVDEGGKAAMTTLEVVPGHEGGGEGTGVQGAMILATRMIDNVLYCTSVYIHTPFYPTE